MAAVELSNAGPQRVISLHHFAHISLKPNSPFSHKRYFLEVAAVIPKGEGKEQRERQDHKVRMDADRE